MTQAAIGTLRLTGAAADTPALRLRAARELAGADLSPPGLPPAAVLVVRRLADPLPRRLAGTELRLRPDAAWERAVRDRLTAMLHAAARPDRRGAVAPDAVAVVFADHAELLACAVRERVHGGLAERWWWRAVRRRLLGLAGAGLGAGRAPSALLAASPREAHAAVARLAGWGEAPAVAAALGPAGAAHVLAALAAEHGLPRELVAGDGITAGAPARGGALSPTSDHRADILPAEPWRDWLPPALRDTVLAPEVRCLFGVALGLATAPHRLRAHETVRQARRWWRAATAWSAHASSRPTARLEEGEQPPAASSPPAIDTAPAVIAGDLPRNAQADTAANEIPAALATSAPSLPSSSLAAAATAHSGEEVGGRRGEAEERGWVGKAIATPAADASPPLDRGPRPLSSVDRELAPAERWCEGGDAENETRAVVPRRDEAVEPETESASAFGEESVATRLAGVLYLIHALNDLGLPEAFERGWRLASAAGPWGTLDLLARGLLGARAFGPGGPGEVPHRDPLWRLLAGLAAWQAEAKPRRRPASQPPYRIPATWLAKLADPCDDFAWSAAAGRLHLWSAAGYLLADVPRDAGPPARQARRELARITGARAAGAACLVRRAASAAPLALPLPPLPRGCPPRLGRWLAAVLPAVRLRLLLALAGGPSAPAFAAALAQPPGTRGAAGAAGDPIARALAAPGRIHLTASHLDLVVPLDAADLAVRRAGLDRDPGWLPAFGRVVYFHYE